MKKPVRRVETMAGAAAGAGLMMARLGLPAVSSCVRQHKGEHVCEEVIGYACQVGAFGLGQ
jgi:hypothetical protein